MNCSGQEMCGIIWEPNRFHTPKSSHSQQKNVYANTLFIYLIAIQRGTSHHHHFPTLDTIKIHCVPELQQLSLTKNAMHLPDVKKLINLSPAFRLFHLFPFAFFSLLSFICCLFVCFFTQFQSLHSQKCARISEKISKQSETFFVRNN